MRLSRTLLFLLGPLLLVGPQSANACHKEAFGETTLEKYEKSKFVVIARGISVEKVKEGEKTYSRFGVKAIKMSVEKVFKGGLRVGSEIVLVEGTGNDHVDSFRESDVGRRYLLFLCSPKRDPDVFQVLRGMNDWLPDEKASELRYHENRAAEDLLYLEKLNELSGRTRVYGKIGINQDSHAQAGKSTIKLFENVKIKISGNGRTHETTTNEDGVFEIYDLSPGSYSISPEIPKGWQISKVSSFGTSGEDDLETGSGIKLTAGRHAFYNYDLHANNIISGNVTDPAGNPMHRVCLELLPVAGKSSDSFLTNVCTNEEGVFEFQQVVEGEYLILVNKGGAVSSDEPFPTVFYPNVFEREKAKIVAIIDGEDKRDISIRIPKISETITVTGSLRSADGVPVVASRVVFRADETDQTIDGTSVARTDEEGKFSIKILKGLKGVLSGTVFIDPSRFMPCPQILKLMSDSGGAERGAQKSNIVKLEAEKNLYDVELKLTLPSCNKTKIIGLMRID